MIKGITPALIKAGMTQEHYEAFTKKHPDMPDYNILYLFQNTGYVVK